LLVRILFPSLLIKAKVEIICDIRPGLLPGLVPETVKINIIYVLALKINSINPTSNLTHSI
jgi:hypothetical protein